jgi:hypothetical protein
MSILWQGSYVHNNAFALPGYADYNTIVSRTLMAENALEAQKGEKPEEKPGPWASILASFTGIVITLVRTFGWPGTLLVLGFFFVNSYATAEQKQRIIALYILGEGISHQWPLIVTSVVFVVVLLAQRKWHNIDEGKLKKQIADLKEKNESLKQRLKKKGRR